MSYHYGYGALEDQLIDACKQYPPDFDAIRALIEKGADVNATLGPQSAPDENLLAEIILYYPETVSAMEHRCFENDTPYDDSPYEGPVLPDDADGRYLPQIIKLFLEHGFCAKSASGSACLHNLIFASHDAHILTAAKLLLQAGAAPDFMEDGETVLSNVAWEASFQGWESNHALENLFEALYKVMDAYLNGKNYWGIQHYNACIGSRIDSVLIPHVPSNFQKPIFNVGIFTRRYKNCFRTPIIFSCEGQPLCVTPYADILVDPNIIPDAQGQVCDISDYFKDCIGHTIINITFDHHSIRKGTTSYGQPIILIRLDNGRTIRVSINYGEVPKEKMVCFFDVLKSE